MKRTCAVVPVEDKRQVYRLIKWLDFGDKLYLSKNDDGSVVMMTMHSNYSWYGLRYTPDKQYELCMSMMLWSPRDFTSGKFISNIFGVERIMEIKGMTNRMVKLNAKSPILRRPTYSKFSPS